MGPKGRFLSLMGTPKINPVGSNNSPKLGITENKKDRAILSNTQVDSTFNYFGGQDNDLF